MLLYLDDDSVDRVLIRRLIDGGHEVLTPEPLVMQILST